MKNYLYKTLIAFVLLAQNLLTFAYDFKVDGILEENSSSQIIKFADAKVKAICVANWDTNGDGELSMDEAAAVTDLGTVFKENTEITSFEELQYFTGLTTISDYAFSGCHQLTGSLTIPNSVTEIGQNAFYGCSDLTGSLTIGNSVTSIGAYAFFDCKGFTGSLTLSNSVTSIGAYAFGSCYGLTGSLTIPNSVTSIGENAFLNCSGFTGSLTIGNSVTSIGENAFLSCSGITSINIPNSVTAIGKDAFRDCSGLTSVNISDLADWCIINYLNEYANPLCSAHHLYMNGEEIKNLVIPNNVKSIGNYAFYGCSGLTSLTISNSVTSIGGSAFSGCSSLTSVTIPNSVTSIGENAFSECSGLTSVTIPNSVTSIGSGVFEYCSGLKSVTIPNNVTSIGNSAFSGCSGLTSVTIPNSVTSIGKYAFAYCSGLTSVTIPNSVTSIGYYAFQKCSGLTSITISNSVTSIGEGTFYACSGLTSVTIPNSVTSIGIWVFSGCSSLTSVTIPNSVTSIGSSVFNGCIGLTSVNISDLAAWCKIVFGDDSSNPLSFAHHLYLNGEEIKDLLIPNNVTSIGNYAFQKCSGLSSVTIPNSVKSIGWSAFSGCSSLTSVTIPNSVTSIGSSAFSNCIGLTSVNISDLVAWCKIIFKNNDSNPLCFAHHLYLNGMEIKDLVIPNNVTSIGMYTFSGCSGLTSVTVPNSLTSIGEGAFSGCSGMTSITIPNSVTSIGNYAFQGCSGLTSVTIPNSVTSIGYSAFSGCSGMTSVVIGNGIKNIYYYAFASCPKLTDVYCYAVNVPNTDKNAFENSYIERTTLHVPAESVKTYKARNPWRNFNAIIEVGETSTYTLTIKSIGNGSALYNGNTIINQTSTFTVNEGSSATITFSPDSGNKIKSVKVNDTDVTSNVSNNQYTISNITASTMLEVEFKDESVITYSLNISATGNGSATYDGTAVRNRTTSFTVNEGTSATITFSPDNDYRIASVKVNSKDATSQVANAELTITNIQQDTNVEVEFEAISIPTYSLSITASGNGSATYDGTSVRNKAISFTVNEGTNATVTFSPDNGNSIASVKLNNSDVTSQVSGNRYTINNITANTTLTVTFQEDVNAMTVDGINYTVISQTDKTVKVTGGDFGQVLTVPATVTQNGKTWTVTGIDANALKDNTELAAVIWNPTYDFTATVSNPNLLLYVKAEQYAPSSIQNVVVNGTASNIVLKEASSGNNFYCPQAFVAQKISYTHNYQMQTGLGESKGWETIALPFDVQTITHETKGTIVPFTQWNNESSKKPFWLMELTGTGFVEAGSIKAYTPYIISMPNNPQYDNQWLLKGKVTFAASSVTVAKTENLNQSVFNGRTFVPCFAERKADEGFYALNVNNDWETNNSGMTEGSMFVWKLRNVHPFEAYMTISSSALSYAIGVFDDMTTGIHVMDEGRWMKEEAVYDLQGRKVENPSKKGVYIRNVKKIIK